MLATNAELIDIKNLFFGLQEFAARNRFRGTTANRVQQIVWRVDAKDKLFAKIVHPLKEFDYLAGAREGGIQSDVLGLGLKLITSSLNRRHYVEKSIR